MKIINNDVMQSREKVRRDKKGQVPRVYLACGLVTDMQETRAFAATGLKLEKDIQ